jgi:hypothetical protein
MKELQQICSHDAFPVRASERAKWDDTFDPAALERSLWELQRLYEERGHTEFDAVTMQTLARALAYAAEIQYSPETNPLVIIYDIWAIVYTALDNKACSIDYIQRRINAVVREFKQ